jgi:hypothetical protein
MPTLASQIRCIDVYTNSMRDNIRRVSIVAGNMQRNIKRCRVSSVKVWQEKAEKILDAKNSKNKAG